MIISFMSLSCTDTHTCSSTCTWSDPSHHLFQQYIVMCIAHISSTYCFHMNICSYFIIYIYTFYFFYLIHFILTSYLILSYFQSDNCYYKFIVNVLLLFFACSISLWITTTTDKKKAVITILDFSTCFTHSS